MCLEKDGLFLSHHRWQDYSVQSRVDQCMSEGSPLVMNSLFIGQTAYIYTANFCIGVKLPIGITSDHWFVGANYKGKKLVDGVETHVFEKLDHYYYASVYVYIFHLVFQHYEQSGSWASSASIRSS